MAGVIQDRLQSILWLSDRYELGINISRLEADETQTYQLAKTYGIPPSVGCEIEIKHSAVFPELMSRHFGEQNEFGNHQIRFRDMTLAQKTEFEKELKTESDDILQEYEKTRQNGIPKGKDCFWEFANKPCYSWRTLATELDALYLAGLIPDRKEHSLHVTFGDVASTGGGMALVLSGLELCFVDPKRVTEATRYPQYDKRSTWARRGDGGVRTRKDTELRLGAIVATELRTLTIRSSEQAANILKASQMLTSILCAYRIRQQTQAPLINDLSKLWPEYRSRLRQLWHERSLPAESWGEPHDNQDRWHVWAECLEAKNHPDTQEGKLAKYINQITYEAEDMIRDLTTKAEFTY